MGCRKLLGNKHGLAGHGSEASDLQDPRQDPDVLLKSCRSGRAMQDETIPLFLMLASCQGPAAPDTKQGCSVCRLTVLGSSLRYDEVKLA